MLDDFLLRALIGGIGVSAMTGPLGCLIVWRRMAYFGNALSHAALLGVALGFALDINPTLGVLLACIGMALAMAGLERQTWLSTDSLLGILAHASFAAGLLALSAMDTVRVDLMGLLFGDILAIGQQDLWVIGGVALGGLGLLAWQWRSLLAMTVAPDIAAVEGVPVEKLRLGLMLLTALVIAVGMKIVGALLIISLLIIPAATARRLSRTPEQMAILAMFCGMAAVVAGLLLSMRYDLPAGPAVVAAASAGFALVFCLPRGRGKE